MSIAYLELPFRATSKLDGNELLVIAIYQESQRVGEVEATLPPKLLCIQADGDLTQAAIGDVNLSWRYDDRHDVWIDATLAAVSKEIE